MSSILIFRNRGNSPAEVDGVLVSVKILAVSKLANEDTAGEAAEETVETNGL